MKPTPPSQASFSQAEYDKKKKRMRAIRKCTRRKKGNQWYFGLKAHIGVDKESGLVHTLVTTAANVSDISQTAALLHGQEGEVWLDAGYVGVEKREDMQTALAANGQDLKWHIARRRKSIEKMADGWQKNLVRAYEKLKAQVRARVEHPFHIVTMKAGWCGRTPTPLAARRVKKNPPGPTPRCDGGCIKRWQVPAV